MGNSFTPFAGTFLSLRWALPGLGLCQVGFAGAGEWVSVCAGLTMGSWEHKPGHTRFNTVEAAGEDGGNLGMVGAAGERPVQGT